MRIDRDQYAELVEKYADELVYDVMEKEAFDIASVKRSASLISGSAKRKASKDVAIAKDIASKYNKDIEKSVKRLDGFQKQWDDVFNSPELKSSSEAQSIKQSLDSLHEVHDARRVQSGRLANIINTSEATHALESKLTSSARKKALGGVGVGTGVAIAGKEGYNHYQSKKAAELLIEAVMYKQAAFNYMNESELVAEASERALNAMGYSL